MPYAATQRARERQRRGKEKKFFHGLPIASLVTSQHYHITTSPRRHCDGMHQRRVR